MYRGTQVWPYIWLGIESAFFGQDEHRLRLCALDDIAGDSNWGFLMTCRELRLKTAYQLSRFQQIQNSLARTVMKAPKSCHITPILRSLHWLKITERIKYKLISLTYKVLTTTQPPYLHNLISVQHPRSTRSSSIVTLARPPSL